MASGSAEKNKVRDRGRGFSYHPIFLRAGFWRQNCVTLRESYHGGRTDDYLLAAACRWQRQPIFHVP
jgi:hypothetical protein